MRKTKVSGYVQKRKGKKVKVTDYKRKAKPKTRKGIKRGPKVNITYNKKKYEVIYYIDDQGRLTPKRKWRRKK